MLNYGGLGLGLIFEAKDMATGVMRTVEVGLRNVDKTASEMAANYKRATDSMRGGLAMMGAGAAALAPLIAFGKSAFGVSSTFAQTEKTFAVFTGSLETAKAHIADLQRFSGQTGLDFLDISNYSRQLQAYGFNVEQVIPMLKSLGSASIAIGDPMIFERLTRALGQVQAKGRLMGEEIRQIAETGIPIYDILQKKLGLTGDQLRQTATNTIDAGKAISAIMEELDERYGDLMNQFMKTPQGVMNSIKNVTTQIKKSIGDAFYEEVTGTMGRISRALGTLGEGGLAQSIGLGFKNLVALVRPAVDAVMGLVTAFGKLVEKQPWIGSFIVTLTGVFGAIMVVAGAVKVATGFAKVAKFWFERWGISMQVSMGKLMWPILAVTAALTAYRYALEKNIGGLGTFWRGLGSMITNTKFDPDKGWITTIPESLKKELDKFGLTDFVTKVWMAFVRIKVAAESFGRGIAKVFAQLDEATKPLRKALGDLGRAMLMPFINLFRSSAESKAKTTIDSWSELGSNLAAIFEKVVPFVQGFADGVAAAIRGLQPVVALVANVIAGAIKTVGKVISWVFGLFGGKGKPGETAEARTQRIGRLVGKLVAGFLLLKKTVAGLNRLPIALMNIGSRFMGLDIKLGNAAAGIRSLRMPGRIFSTLKNVKLPSALWKVQQWLGTLKDGAVMARGGIKGLIRSFGDLAKSVWQFGASLTKSACNAVKQFVVSLAKGIASLATFAAKMIWTGIQAVGKFVAGMAKAIAQVVLLGAKLIWAGVKAAVSFIGGLLSSAAAAVASFIPAMLTAASSVWAFTVALLANPVTWIVVGIVALTASLYLLWKNWDKVTAWIKNVWGKFTGWISERTEGMRISVTGAFQRMVDGIIGWWNNLVTRTKIVWDNIKLVVMEGVLGIVDFLARVPVLGNLFKGAQGAVAESVAGIRAELAKLDQASLGAMAIETKPPAPSYSTVMPAFAAPGPGFAYAAPAPVFAPSRGPSVAMPPIRPATASPGALEQPGRGEPITVKSQLVLDGRIIAESVERVRTEDRVRSGRW